MTEPNYEAIGRYHTLKAQHKKLLEHIKADGEMVKQAAFVVSIQGETLASSTFSSAIARIEYALPRLKSHAETAEQLLTQMQQLKAEYHIVE